VETIHGVARSMPTSGAVDRVAQRLGLQLYEVPTGWKFFGNLMDAKKLSICGEESFGTGSDHIREKDGLWAVLAWLAILAAANPSPTASPKRSSISALLSPRASASATGAGTATATATAGAGAGTGAGATPTTPKPLPKLVGVSDIVKNHWLTYGRNYYTRYDYEGIPKATGAVFMDQLRSEWVVNFSAARKSHQWGEYTLHHDAVDDFAYKDSVDGVLTREQGIRFKFGDGSTRIVFRLSGTDASNATVRLYIEQHQPALAEGAGRTDEQRLEPCLQPTSAVLARLVAIALEVSKMEAITGKKHPDVIT